MTNKTSTGRPIEELRAGDAFRQTMIDRADAWERDRPMGRAAMT